jgi:hypothetical protein
MTENEAPSTRADEWLTVSQTAAALEVSERTVRRRCENGKLAARLTTTDSGAAWEVSAAAVKAADAAAITADTLRTRSESESDEAAAIPTDTADSAPQAAAIAADSGFLAHLQSENAFLRVAIEQHQRSEAELRAALREALRAMPKAIEGEKLAEVGAQKSAPNGLEAPKSGAAAIVSGAAKTGGKRAPRREARPLWKVILGLR